MHIERIENGFQVDAVALGPLLGVPADDVQRLMREGRIACLSEEGQGEDSGRHRITFRHGAIRVRLTVNDAGDVLMRTRTAVAPRPEPKLETGAEIPMERSARQPNATADDVTRRLEEQFHGRHRRWLEELGKLAEMIEDIHENDEGVPAGLHHTLGRIKGVLEAHMHVSERVVFPEIRRGTTSGLEPWIDALRYDHELLERDCARVREISRDFQLPDAACTSWATLYAGLAEFVEALNEHMRLENEKLFQPFKREPPADP